MKYPILDNLQLNKEINTQFAGYNHQLSCQEGFFYDEKNVTLNYFPMLASRKRRKAVKVFTNFQGISSGTKIAWVDDGDLYYDGVKQTLSTGIELDDKTYKTMVRMGAYIVIFPDKVWFNTSDATSGNIEQTFTASNTSVTFQQVDSKGSNITLWNGVGDPTDGAYKIDTKDGKSVLKVYSATTNMWANVATTYFKISLTNIGKDFKKGDGVKIEIDFTGITWDRAKDIFVNDEGNGKRSSNFAIHERDDDYIIVVGLLDEATKTFTLPSIYVGRECPDIEYVCECQNRLWGVKANGQEIYACKLGDPTNWNCFAGISTDSWRATVGSDGVFTGAFAYMGNPLLFKENSLLRISISASGAHSYKEMICRGVQNGSSKSLVQVNELLYYKSPTSVCVYDGNFPQEIGDEFGDVKYSLGVGGGWDNKYYLEMESDDGSSLFVYDVNVNMWAKEDNVSIYEFCNTEDTLFFVASDKVAYAVEGEDYATDSDEYPLEDPVFWEAESGFIGYQITDKKYLSRFAIRMNMEVGAEAWLYIEYDSSGKWEYVWNVSGKGTKTFAIPVRPKRCDHFRYKIKGHGACKMIALTKEYGEGSDM